MVVLLESLFLSAGWAGGVVRASYPRRRVASRRRFPEVPRRVVVGMMVWKRRGWDDGCPKTMRRTAMVKSSKGARIGVISDTHGYLDPRVLEEFAGVDHIIHAGDIMDAATLEALAEIAPVTAVAGNMDDGKLGKLPREITGKVGGIRFVVGHKRKRLMKRLSLGKIDGVGKHESPDLVVCGHDHLPAVEWVDGTLFLNPGSASAPHYEDDDPTVAIVESGPAGLGVSFVRIPRRADDES
jgi:putative phosphoesterase